MTFAEARALIRAGKSDLLRACSDALDRGTIRPVAEQPGELSVSETKATYEIRRATSAAAAVDVNGIDELLSALNVLDPSERVLNFSFSGSELVFSVFVVAGRALIVGCIRIRRRPGMPPSLKEQGLV